MENPPEVADARPSPGQIAANGQAREKIETLASILPEKYRLPLLLHYFDGLTQAEIAQAIDAPEGTVRSRIARGLRPPELEDVGLNSALRAHLRDLRDGTGFVVDAEVGPVDGLLDDEGKLAIYRIVQEGLSNACNYSKSKNIVIGLVQRGDSLRIKIRDWGIGFDPKTVQKNRFGLEGIRERTRVLRGKCNIKSNPGEGTTIIVELPVIEKKVKQ